MAALSALGVDIQYVVTGVRSTNLPAVANVAESGAEYRITPRELAVLELFGELNEEQKKNILHALEEKKRLNACLIELEAMKKQAGGTK